VSAYGILRHIEKEHPEFLYWDAVCRILQEESLEHIEDSVKAERNGWWYIATHRELHKHNPTNRMNNVPLRYHKHGENK